MIEQPLNITIVGAGIGGLCAAIGLRQQGHIVKVYEQSRLAKEVGAALHIAPNCFGLLRRLGINPRDYGSVEMLGMTSFGADGSTLNSRDMREDNKAWQHPWDLIHRARLHNALKDKAVADGPGRTVELLTATRVDSVNAATGTITLENGEQHAADLIIGADGVHSKTRKAISDMQPFDSGKSAYRFLVDVKDMAKHEELKSILDANQYFFIWIGDDRRLVMYPCDGGATMNLAAIFPSELLEAEGEGWSQRGSKQNLLQIYEGFEKRVKIILGLADEPQAWTLLDMDQVPTFVKDKLVLLGDASHPFLPHQAQGGAQAIEDGMSLAAILPLGTKAPDIPSRLQLYEKQRYERSHKVQEFTRLTGRDVNDTDGPPDFAKFVPYNVGHDEWHASTAALQKHLAEQSTQPWHRPVAFGPIPSLDLELCSQVGYRFKSSRTHLQTLLPPDVSFVSPTTVCEASFVCSTIKCQSLKDTTHRSCSLYIHGVRRKEQDGSFIAVTFEDCVDTILMSNGSKQFSAIDVETGENTSSVKLSWRGVDFGHITLDGLTAGKEQRQNGDDRYFAWDRAEVSTTETKFLRFHDHIIEHSAESAEATFTPCDSNKLPTLHGIASVLAEIPNYGTVHAWRRVKADGVPSRH